MSDLVKRLGNYMPEKRAYIVYTLRADEHQILAGKPLDQPQGQLVADIPAAREPTPERIDAGGRAPDCRQHCGSDQGGEATGERTARTSGALPDGNLRCDIFIRSYYKDLDWLVYCLVSINKYCSGFRSVVVVVPRSTWSRLRNLGRVTSNARFEVCRNYRDDYLGQQVTKLHADLFTDADLICHVDSDCIFTRPVRPSDLMLEGKVRVLMRPIASLGRHRPWQQSTEEFLGWRVAYDFMQHPPFAFPRRLYAEVRNHALELHGVDLERYVIGRPPRGFSEYNVLGAYSYERHRDWFTWVDLNAEEIGEHVCRWYWSWGGLTSEIRQEIEALLST
jgi:hypothetical protein